MKVQVLAGGALVLWVLLACVAGCGRSGVSRGESEALAEALIRDMAASLGQDEGIRIERTASNRLCQPTSQIAVEFDARFPSPDGYTPESIVEAVREVWEDSGLVEETSQSDDAVVAALARSNALKADVSVYPRSQLVHLWVATECFADSG
jgi:hypothetical protein